MSKIAFISTLKIPSGQASVNRILSLAKGLVINGDEVHIISSNINADYSNGEIIDNIHIYNIGHKQGVFGLASALVRILLMIRREKYDAIISTTNSLLLIYPLAAICHISSVKFIQEKSEFPFSLMKKDFFHQLYGKVYVNTTYKLMDAMIIMTEPLIEYYKTKVKKECKLIHIPMTVDSSRFDMASTSVELGFQYIAYCGNMSGNKDGVENLIESFSMIESQIPDLKLLLIGDTTNKVEFERLRQKAIDTGCDNIVFYGRVERSEMPALLKGAKALVLARPSSLQSAGGFPTKLGEYLATGNPVIVTAVGDIPKYLNKSNSYIVRPDDNRAFADAIIECITNSSQSKIIGMEGRKLMERFFDFKIQSEALHFFIMNLK